MTWTYRQMLRIAVDAECSVITVKAYLEGRRRTRAAIAKAIEAAIVELRKAEPTAGT